MTTLIFPTTLLLLFYKDSLAAVNRGVPIANIVALPVKEEIGKMKYIPQDEFDAKIEEIQSAITKQCSEA